VTAAKAPVVSFQDFITSPSLAGRWFEGESWSAWKSLWRAHDGCLLSPEDLATYRRCTGRSEVPRARSRESWWLMSRRTGKSLMAAARGAWLASCRDWSRYRKPGQRLVGMIFAADRAQAAETAGYLRGFFDEIPALRALVEPRRGKAAPAAEVRLVTGITIRVVVASFRRSRGRTAIFSIMDEASFWHDGSASLNPCAEVVRAVRPSLLTTAPDSEFIVISSKYRRVGTVYDAWKAHFAVDGDPVFIAESDTLSMNPTVPREEVERAFREDPEAARAEYGGLWRDDLESYVSPEAVEAVTMRGRLYLPYDPRFRHTAFCDPAGGSGQDSMTVAIVRRERGKAVACLVREWKPRFNPDAVVAEAAALLREYGLQRVVGDRYAGSWPAARFQAHGIRYAEADLTKSDYFISFLPLVNGQRVELLDHPKTIAQLCGLERSSGKTGKDTVTHAPNGHDDLINAVAGASVLALRREMLAHEGERERARQSAPAPRRDRFGAAEVIRDGIVFRCFPDGREVPDRAATEAELLEHSFVGCPRCGQPHLTINGASECPRSEPWSGQEVLRRAVSPTAHPEVRLYEEGHERNIALTAKTIGWNG